MKGASETVLRLRRLWDEHIHLPFSGTGSDPRFQEVALLLARQGIFRAGGELGEPVRSYVARLIAIEDLLAELPRT